MSPNLRYEVEAVQDESDRPTAARGRSQRDRRDGPFGMGIDKADIRFVITMRCLVTRRLLLGVRPRRSRWRTGAVVAVIPARRPTHPNLFHGGPFIPASTTSPPPTPSSSVWPAPAIRRRSLSSSRRVRRRQEQSPRHSVPARGMGDRPAASPGWVLVHQGGLVEADLQEMSHFYGARSGGRRCDTYPRGYDECALISRIWRR
jgi:hypothetical protein